MSFETCIRNLFYTNLHNLKVNNLLFSHGFNCWQHQLLFSSELRFLAARRGTCDKFVFSYLEYWVYLMLDQSTKSTQTMITSINKDFNLPDTINLLYTFIKATSGSIWIMMFAVDNTHSWTYFLGLINPFQHAATFWCICTVNNF